MGEQNKTHVWLAFSLFSIELYKSCLLSRRGTFKHADIQMAENSTRRIRRRKKLKVYTRSEKRQAIFLHQGDTRNLLVKGVVRAPSWWVPTLRARLLMTRRKKCRSRSGARACGEKREETAFHFMWETWIRCVRDTWRKRENTHELMPPTSSCRRH